MLQGPNIEAMRIKQNALMSKYKSKPKRVRDRSKSIKKVIQVESPKYPKPQLKISKPQESPKSHK